MAKRKRKTSGRSTASRRKNRTQDRMPAGLITLFAGLVLMALAFVPGSSAWRTMHDVLFGVFGCGSFVLGAALCYLAILYTRGEDLLPHIAKLVLGLIFASGTVIVFSDIPTDQTAAQMTAACYHNGMSAWLSGGALGAVLGGTLLLLCGRPAANLVMAALAACASLYIFDVTPAECWQWLCNVGGSVHEKGLAVHEQNAARRAERLAERAAEEAEAEEYEAYDDDLPEDEVGEGEDYYGGEEPAAPAFHIQPPGWLAGVFHWGHQVMQGGEQAEPAPAPAPEAQTPPQPEPAPVQVEKSRPRAPFDIDLGPDHTTVTEGGSEPIEPIILGPGGTFGMDPLSHLSDTSHYHAATADLQPAVQPAADEFELKLDDPAKAAPEEAAGDELDNLISRAVSGHAPYYGEQDVSSETTLDLPQESEFSVPLTPEPTFDTPLVPVEDDNSFGFPVDGEEGVFTGTTPAEEPHSAPTASAAPAIPTIGGSFSVNEAVSNAWNSGRPISDVLNAQPAAPVPQAAPVVPASSVAAAVSAQPQQPTGTESSFVVPQRGEAAHLQVSTSVGNSASAPISSPPSAAKADPNTMNLAAMQAEPVEPYCYPSLNLFNATRPDDEAGAAREMKKNADILVNTLDSFGVKTTMLDICRGPSVTRYELQPQAGIKVSRITSLADDIALNLATAGVRIEAPIPGKPAVGIEVPNKIRSTVNIRAVFESQNYINMRSPLTMALGKDIAGAAQVADLCKMPHLLIAGSTGSGKSVCVNSIIISFLFRSSPEDVKLILIDPKVVELAEYNGIPHLLMPVVTEPRKAAGALGASVAEMERRYKLFAENNVREIKAYNKLAAQTGLEHLPYIAIVIDELADLMMVAGKEVEDYICRIAQKARAAGIHLIVATQRPSVDVITGLIKANIPSRIAFAVSSQIDSRTILDASGAEKLLGNGDMLFLPVGASKPVRVQGTFVTDEEIGAVLSFIKSTSSTQYDEEMIAEMERRAVAEKGSKKGSDDDGDTGGALDPMFEQAVECVIDAGQASTSLLQRRCKLGYARAARIMDQMEQEKIIGPYEGAKPRTVLVSKAQWEERKLNGQYDEA